MWTPRQGSPRNLGLAVAQTISADWNPNCVWLAVSQLTERQRIRNQIDAGGDLYAGGLRKGVASVRISPCQRGVEKKKGDSSLAILCGDLTDHV